jgi:hypothetical protein
VATDESSVQDPDSTDELVLEEPGEFTVDEVLEVFGRSTPQQVEAAKELEREGKDRAGISGWTPPAPEQSAGDEPRFTRERLLSREGEQIAGHPHTVIAGALYDEQGEDFTRAEIQAKAEAFLNRPVGEA